MGRNFVVEHLDSSLPPPSPTSRETSSLENIPVFNFLTRSKPKVHVGVPDPAQVGGTPLQLVLDLLEHSGLDGMEVLQLRTVMEAQLSLNRTIKTHKLALYLQAFPDYFEMLPHTMRVRMRCTSSTQQSEEAWSEYKSKLGDFSILLDQNGLSKSRRILESENIDSKTLPYLSVDDLMDIGLAPLDAHKVISLRSQASSATRFNAFSATEQRLSIPSIPASTAPSPSFGSWHPSPTFSVRSSLTRVSRPSSLMSSANTSPIMGSSSLFSSPNASPLLPSSTLSLGSLHSVVDRLAVPTPLCASCQQRPPDVVLVPCMHMLYCAMCMDSWDFICPSCPKCGAGVCRKIKCLLLDS